MTTTMRNVAKATIKKTKPMMRSPLPVDKGWAWMVMLANFLNWLVAISFIRSLAILFPVLLRRYRRSVAFTTLAFGLAEIAESLANMLIPWFFLPRFGVRTLCLTGAFLQAASIMALAFFSADVVMVNVLFSCVGFARGLVLNPQVYVLGCYFRSRLSFASACANMGISVATLLSPLATRFLLDAYDLHWTFLIIGAWSLHSVMASLLLRPTSAYGGGSVSTKTDDSISEAKEESNGKEERTQCINQTHEDEADKNSQVKAKQTNILNRVAEEEYTEEERQPYIDKTQGKEDKVNQEKAQLQYNTVTDSSSNLHFYSSVTQQEDDDDAQEQSESQFSTIADPSPLIHSDISLRDGFECRETNNPIEQKTYPQDSNPKQTFMSPSQGSQVERRMYYYYDQQCLAECDKATDDNNDHFELAHPKNRGGTGCSAQCMSFNNIKERLKRMFSESICAKPVALLLIIASGLGVHTQAGNVYLPVLGLENGMTSDQLPWLLTITGATDIVGKLTIGLLADKNKNNDNDNACLQPLYLACLTQAVAGVALQMAPLYQGLVGMATLSTVYGLSAGVLHILLPTLIVRRVGLASLPHVISGYYLLNCVATFVMHVVVGTVRDSTGSFAGGFQFVGCLFLASVAVLLLIVPVSRSGARRRRRRRTRCSCWRGRADDDYSSRESGEVDDDAEILMTKEKAAAAAAVMMVFNEDKDVETKGVADGAQFLNSKNGNSDKARAIQTQRR